MATFENVEKIETPKKPSFWAKIAGASAVGTALVATAPARAEGVADLFTSVSTELAGVESGVLTILGVLATVLAVFIGWSYVKKAR